jgi:hypothetical protein
MKSEKMGEPDSRVRLPHEWPTLGRLRADGGADDVRLPSDDGPPGEGRRIGQAFALRLP